MRSVHDGKRAEGSSGRGGAAASTVGPAFTAGAADAEGAAWAPFCAAADVRAGLGSDSGRSWNRRPPARSILRDAPGWSA